MTNNTESKAQVTIIRHELRTDRAYFEARYAGAGRLGRWLARRDAATAQRALAC